MRRFWIAAFCTFAFGCGDVKGPTPVEPRPDTVVVAVDIAPSTATLVTGDSIHLEATLRNSRGDTLAADIQWTTADSLVARVAANGTVRAMGPGATTVRAQAATLTATVVITVRRDTVAATIDIAPSSKALFVGESAAFVATIRNARGDTLNTVVTWSVDDTAIARVSNDGTVTALRPGTAIVRAQSGGRSATATITAAFSRALARLDIEPDSLIIPPNGRYTLTVRGLDASGAETSAGTVRWRTLFATDKVELENFGVVLPLHQRIHALSTGSTYVWAESGSVRDSIRVTVSSLVAFSAGATSFTLDTTYTAPDSATLKVIPNTQFQIASVVATLRGVQFELQPSAGEWKRTVPLITNPYDSTTVEVKVTDIMGNYAVTQFSFQYNPRIIVVITSPVDSTYAGASVRVRARCYDRPLPCALLRASFSGAPETVTGSSDIDATVALPDQPVTTITFTAAEVGGPVVVVGKRTVFGGAGGATLIHSLGGKVLDSDGERSLWADSTDLHLVTRDGADQIIFSSNRRINGQLDGPFDAKFVQGGVVLQTRFYDLLLWSSTGLQTLGFGQARLVSVAGDYLAFIDGLENNLRRMDRRTGERIFIATGVDTRGYILTPTGELVFAARVGSYTDIFSFANGRTQPIAADPSRYEVNPQGGLETFMYEASTLLGAGPSRYQLMIHESSGNRPLAEVRESSEKFHANNGWFTFLRADAIGTAQVWVRSPTGVETQVTVFGRASVIEAIASDGAIVFTNSDRRYAWRPGMGAARDIGAAIGSAVWRENGFLIFVGKSVLQIAPF